MTVLLRDVATAAGTSVSTASRALRGDPRISPGTRLRVTEAAARLGYQPDPALGALAGYRDRVHPRNRTETIVAISTWPPDYRVADSPLTQILQARCARLGYQLESITLGTDPAEHRACGARLVARGIRGLLLGTGLVQQDELDLPWHEFACISISGAPAMRRFPSVTANYAQNLRLVLDQLRRRGYRRPGLVLDPWILRVTRDASLTGWGHAFDFGHVQPAAPLLLTGTADAEQLHAWIHAERIDAVIAFSGHLLTQLRASRVAETVGFAALDAGLHDGIAGIVQPRAACQQVALDLLATRLRQHEYGPMERPYAIQIEGDWIDGPTLRDALPSV